MEYKDDIKYPSMVHLNVIYNKRSSGELSPISNLIITFNTFILLHAFFHACTSLISGLHA